MAVDLASSLVEHFEGCELTAYKDTEGYWTVGWGHLLDQSIDWTGYTITQETADTLLDQDMAQARALAPSFPYFSIMNPVRQAVLVSMAFQMGAKPLHWPEFMASLAAQDYASASSNGLDSDWAKETPERAKLEMAMLQSGTWQV